MKLIGCLVGLVLFPMVLLAETYSWVDDHGTVNFSDSYSTIPRKYRNTVRRRSDVSPSQPARSTDEPATGVGDTPGREATAGKPGFSGTTSAGLFFGGRKGAEWQREFRERNAELELYDAKVRELAEVRKKNAYASGPEQVDLYKQHRDAVARYNEAIKRYNELNDAANKAGVPAEFRK